MFDESEQREIKRVLALCNLDEIFGRGHGERICPCCLSDATVLVDIGFEVGTGREVQTGPTRQCERCLAYFIPGEPCSENFTE